MLEGSLYSEGGGGLLTGCIVCLQVDGPINGVALICGGELIIGSLRYNKQILTSQIIILKGSM